MTFHSRVRLFLLAAGLALASVACGGGSTSMTAPEPVAPATPAGATIVGTVQSGAVSGGALSASSSSGLRVSVVGTSLATATDDLGQFTLTGVPAGRVELRFEGPDIDARLEIEGLESGQTLTITVQVSGSSATRVDDDSQNQAEFKGRVESVSPGTNSLRVSGREVVVVPGTTRILGRDNQPILLVDLHVDDLVEVEGRTLTDGRIQASKIKLEDDDENEDGVEVEVEFKGRIESISKPDMRVSGTDVTTDGGTRYRDDRGNPVSFEFFKVDDKVEVDGQKLPSGKVLAKTIKLED